MQRDFDFEVKAVLDGGQFEGLAAVYNNVDQGGDRIVPGAFTKTLASRGAEVPLLWSHDSAEPIGLGSLTDSAEGLRIKGSLDLDTQAGRDAYSRVKKKIVKGLSIGYHAVKSDVEAGVRLLKEIRLQEVSLCCFPMNESALVSSVKSITTLRDFQKFLHSAGWSQREAAALAKHGFGGLSTAEDSGAEAELLEFLKAANAA